jgi:hypothetical protein
VTQSRNVLFFNPRSRLPAGYPEGRRHAYLLTPKGTAEKAAMTKVFLKRKIQGYGGQKAEIEALRGEPGDEVVPENSLRT